MLESYLRYVVDGAVAGWSDKDGQVGHVAGDDDDSDITAGDPVTIVPHSHRESADLISTG